MTDNNIYSKDNNYKCDTHKNSGSISSRSE